MLFVLYIFCKILNLHVNNKLVINNLNIRGVKRKNKYDLFRKHILHNPNTKFQYIIFIFN